MIDRCHCSWICQRKRIYHEPSVQCSTNSKHTSNNRVFALGPTELKWNLYARRQPVKGTGSVDLRASVPASAANPDNIYILTFFRIFISIVESSLYAETMAGPSGHRREKKWILNNFNMYKKFPLNAGKSWWNRPNEIPTTVGLQQRPPNFQNFCIDNMKSVYDPKLIHV